MSPLRCTVNRTVAPRNSQGARRRVITTSMLRFATGVIYWAVHMGRWRFRQSPGFVVGASEISVAGRVERFFPTLQFLLAHDLTDE